MIKLNIGCIVFLCCGCQLRVTREESLGRAHEFAVQMGVTNYRCDIIERLDANETLCSGIRKDIPVKWYCWELCVWVLE